jgi:hypothetical protein
VRKGRYRTSVEERQRKPRNMAVKFAVLGGGDTVASSFSDNFTRANANTWGSTWVRLYGSIPAGGTGAGASESINTNKGRITGSGGINPVQYYMPIFTPTSIISGPIYNLRGKFVQFTWQGATGTLFGALGLNYNRELLNGTTTGPLDIYLMINNGRIDKIVGGGVQSTIGAATWVVAVGDVLRFECLVNAAQTSIQLQSIRNGVVLQTITDANPGAILMGFPGIVPYAVSGTPTTSFFEFTAFSCGPLSALSV